MSMETASAAWAWPWNAPLAPIDNPLPSLCEIRQKQQEIEALMHAESQLQQQPALVRMEVIRRANRLEAEQGAARAGAFIAGTFVKRMLPRLGLAHARYHIPKMSADTAHLMWRFNHLPDMSRGDIALLAQDIASFIWLEASIINQEMPGSGDFELAHTVFMRTAAITRAFRQSPPYWNQLIARCFCLDKTTAAISRMTSDKWWTERLRRHAGEWREHLHIALGNVSKRASPCVSKIAIYEWKEQKRRTREFLKLMELEDEEGNRISLIDKYWGSVANPAIRRTEMMVRIRGFETICNSLGYMAEFYTLTAPSRFHATTIRGDRNPKWDGSSPADTQRYLRQLWSKIRARLHRQNLRIFGIRVTEPHHDGTPHWHMLFFMRPAQAEKVRETLRDYALAEDSSELLTSSARRARFHSETIDPEKGSATGYVAKYISKNIDGYALDGERDDESGRPLKEAAIAAAAWSVRWRIRQFQFIGGAPVTVYRELRRMADSARAAKAGLQFKAVHDAADTGDWAGYIRAQGGPFVRRAELAARLWYAPRAERNAYGEDVMRIRGVFAPLAATAEPVLTRPHTWKIVRRQAGETDVSGANAPPWSSVNNCTVADQRLSHALKSRGFNGSDNEIAILKRGSSLNFHGDSRLFLHQGRLEEIAGQSGTEPWPGWRQRVVCKPVCSY